MPHSSLIPEPPLVFSPGLAATIGLEEAILLQQLASLLVHRTTRLRQGFQWLSVERDFLLQQLPFWGPADLYRICRSLVDKGVILIESPPLHSHPELIFAMNESGGVPWGGHPSAGAPEGSHPSAGAPGLAIGGQNAATPGAYTQPPIGPAHDTHTNVAPANATAEGANFPRPAANTARNRFGPAASGQPSSAPSHATHSGEALELTRRSAAQLHASWGPSEDLLQLLGLNHNIPRQFALDQLEDFIFYWRERGEPSHAWENKFRQHVISCWRREQQQQAEAFRVDQNSPLDNHWRPSADALEIMLRSGIDREFIDEAVPEFILYWRERGEAPKELNSKFIQHIRIQWAKYTSSMQHSTEPKRINEDWQPDNDVFDILRLSHIDEDFARELLPEFIVYWRDSNQAHTSWNSKFLQHVKYHWAKQHRIDQAGHSHDGPQGSPRTSRTRDRSLADDLNDTSWAD
ncbi:MAG: DnaT-like ssDNA-binding domain-containing protein [Haliea sp.]|nr:DnaT-like ssDNA-binding domain-containing protein [Haliea sp.]